VVTKDEFNFSLDKNKGYCYAGKKFFAEQSEECLPTGLLDISHCQKGEPPIVISWPNFLYSTDFVQNSINGMKQADEQQDKIELDLEPRLGAILQARRRFQINISMWKGVNLTMPGLDLSRFRNSIVPVLQIDEYSQIDSESLELIKDKLINTEWAVRFGAIGAIVTSLIAVAVVVLYVVQRKRQSTSGGSRIWRPKSIVAPKQNGVQTTQSQC